MPDLKKYLPLSLLLLAACGQAQEAFEESFSESYDENFRKSCKASITEQKVPTVLGEAICDCGADKVGELSISDRISPPESEMNRIMEECVAQVMEGAPQIGALDK